MNEKLWCAVGVSVDNMEHEISRKSIGFDLFTKTRIEYCEDSTKSLAYFRTIQGHSGGRPIDREFMGFFLNSRQDMPLSAVIPQAILHTSSQEDTGTTTTNSRRKLSNHERDPSLSTPHHTSTTPQMRRTICHSRHHEAISHSCQEPSPGLVE